MQSPKLETCLALFSEIVSGACAWITAVDSTVSLHNRNGEDQPLAFRTSATASTHVMCTIVALEFRVLIEPHVLLPGCITIDTLAHFSRPSPIRRVESVEVSRDVKDTVRRVIAHVVIASAAIGKGYCEKM